MTRQTDDMAAQSLLSRLGRGQDAAKTKAALSEELGWTEREIKARVRELRLEGHLILASNDGYWLDGNAEAWLRRQDSQIAAMRKTREAVFHNWQKQKSGQQILFPDAI